MTADQRRPAGELTDLRGLIAAGALDAEIGALVWLLAERGVPLVVAATQRDAAETMRTAFDRLVRGTQPGRDTLAGGVVIADSLAGALERLGATDGMSDETRDLGIVLVVRDGRLAVAHYVRPVERDAAGHLQRRPPAVLAARDEHGRLDHFYWAVTEELATRAGMTRGELEDEHDVRVRSLGSGESGVGPPDARH